MHSQPGQSPSKARLRWQCRRGMKELEGLLIPFFEVFFDTLTAAQQAHFERLLSATDADLYAWFLGYETPPDHDLAQLLELIQEKLKAGAIQPEI